MRLLIQCWCAVHAVMQLLHLLDDMAVTYACMHGAACSGTCLVVRRDKQSLVHMYANLHQSA